jgi:hypothetical protein
MAARLPFLWVALGVPLAPSSRHRLLAVAACGDFSNSGRLLLPSRGDLSTIVPPLLSGSRQLLTYALVIGVRTLRRHLPISFPSYPLPIVLHWRVSPPSDACSAMSDLSAAVRWVGLASPLFHHKRLASKTYQWAIKFIMLLSNIFASYYELIPLILIIHGIFFTKSAFFGLQLWESGNPCFLVVLLTFRKLHELKRIRDFRWSSFYWKIEPKRQKKVHKRRPEAAYSPLDVASGPLHGAPPTTSREVFGPSSMMYGAICYFPMMCYFCMSRLEL